MFLGGLSEVDKISSSNIADSIVWIVGGMIGLTTIYQCIKCKIMMTTCFDFFGVHLIPQRQQRAPYSNVDNKKSWRQQYIGSGHFKVACQLEV